MTCPGVNFCVVLWPILFPVFLSFSFFAFIPNARLFYGAMFIVVHILYLIAVFLFSSSLNNRRSLSAHDLAQHCAAGFDQIVDHQRLNSQATSNSARHGSDLADSIRTYSTTPSAPSLLHDVSLDAIHGYTTEDAISDDAPTINYTVPAESEPSMPSTIAPSSVASRPSIPRSPLRDLDGDSDDASVHRRYRTDLHAFLDAERNAHPPSRDAFNIVQWNVRGLESSAAALWSDIVYGHVSVLMLQEQYVGYKYAERWQPITLEGYHRIHDPLHKTAIYIRDGVKHREIPLRLHTHGVGAKHTLHACAAALRVRIGTQWKYLVLLNIYKSPSGNADVLQIQNYELQCREYIRKKLRQTDLHGFIIGGDFNATHSCMMSSRGVVRCDQSAVDGLRLHNWAARERYAVLNNGQPTRWFADRDTRTICHSWLDWSLATDDIAERTRWRVREIDMCSDHYQIWLTLDVSFHKRTDDFKLDQRWKLANHSCLWTRFEQRLAEEWDVVAAFVDQVEELQCSNEDKGNKVAHRIIDMFHVVAMDVFGLSDPKDKHWKRWITKGGQQVSIRYHEVYRRIKRHDIPNTAADFKEWERLKALRKRMFHGLRRSWIERKYQRCRDNGDDH